MPKSAAMTVRSIMREKPGADFNAYRLERPVDPESVEPSFLDHNDWKALARPGPRLLLDLREALQQPGDIAAAQRVLRHPFSAAWRQRCDQPDRSTEFQRNENRAKIGADSGRRMGLVSYNLHGRLQSAGQQPHSARASVAIHLPMGSCLPWPMTSVPFV